MGSDTPVRWLPALDKQVVLDADGATLRTKLSSYFPQNNLSPVEIDWAAEAVDRDILALVSKSTSK